MSSICKIYKATDEAVERIREAGPEDMVIEDLRGRHRWWGTACNVATALFVFYFCVANYCRFKETVGMDTTYCTCSR